MASNATEVTWTAAPGDGSSSASAEETLNEFVRVVGRVVDALAAALAVISSGHYSDADAEALLETLGAQLTQFEMLEGKDGVPACTAGAGFQVAYQWLERTFKANTFKVKLKADAERLMGFLDDNDDPTTLQTKRWRPLQEAAPCPHDVTSLAGRWLPAESTQD
jgi:hypothetical protein